VERGGAIAVGMTVTGSHDMKALGVDVAMKKTEFTQLFMALTQLLQKLVLFGCFLFSLFSLLLFCYFVEQLLLK
jgi:hypothetical protein